MLVLSSSTMDLNTSLFLWGLFLTVTSGDSTAVLRTYTIF